MKPTSSRASLRKARICDLRVYDDIRQRSDLSPVERDRLCWLSGLLMFRVATLPNAQQWQGGAGEPRKHRRAGNLICDKP